MGEIPPIYATYLNMIETISNSRYKLELIASTRLSILFIFPWLSFQSVKFHVYIIKFSIQKSNRVLSKLIFILSMHILDNQNSFCICEINCSINCREGSNPVCAQNCLSKPRCTTFILKWKWTSNLVREFWKSTSKILGFTCLTLVELVTYEMQCSKL